MAITDIYNSLTFGGVNSLDYGVYISGPGVFDAPTRDVELVDVPGRNGAIEIDRGHWNNIEVRYTAGSFGDDQSDFAKNVNAFRNAIVSQLGYQRLTDTYNPEEYRLGIYASGLQVSAVNYNQAGEFELVFNCKPQRFLLEGEAAVTVSSGDTITNPTLYESSPLISAFGYGNLNMNDYQISLSNDVVGTVVLKDAVVSSSDLAFDGGILELGDSIYFDEFSARFYVSGKSTTTTINNLHSFSFSNTDIPTEITPTFDFQISSDNRRAVASINFGRTDFEYLQNQNVTFKGYFFVQVTYTTTSGNASERLRGEVWISVKTKQGGSSSVGVRCSNFTSESGNLTKLNFGNNSANRGELFGDSTQTVLGSPTYIDTEIGEVYKIKDGQFVDLNKYIALGSDLPKLSPGENEVTFDNTFSQIQIAPRWWEL